MNIIDKSIYTNLELLPIDLSGWNGNCKIFKTLIEKIKPSTIIEVGTWKGQSAINMANIIQQNNLNCNIYCVDTWLGALEFWGFACDTPDRNLLQKNGYPQIYYQFLSNVVHTNTQDIILPFPCTSLIAARFFKNKKISADLIYIDASHDEFDVYHDIKNYYSLLSENGIIFGDDYITFPGVALAVNKFTEEMNLSLNLTEHNFWIINKKTIS
jgi:predicted O-methyltransferase YrrM